MTETKKPKQTRREFVRNPRYEKPEVEERVVVLRGEGKTWDELTNIMREELNEPKMSVTLSKTIYNRAMAKSITTESRSGKKFTDFTKDLNKMYGKAISVLSRWINAADKLSLLLEDEVESGNINAVKAYGTLLKTAPQMKAISSEIRDYMKFQQEQQDKIIVEQKELIWDESQMLDFMDKYLKQLEKEGKIIWLKPKIM